MLKLGIFDNFDNCTGRLVFSFFFVRPLTDMKCNVSVNIDVNFHSTHGSLFVVKSTRDVGGAAKYFARVQQVGRFTMTFWKSDPVGIRKTDPE